MKDKKSFEITGGKGFHITFENGYTISTQFGYSNYCENYSNYEIKNNARANDCEMAIWKDGDNWFTKDFFREIGIELNDDVAANIDIETWYKIVEIVKNKEESCK